MNGPDVFRDRRDAGRALAKKLGRYAGRDDILVLALPRGGVPVGYEVAEALDAPLDVFLVRKIGAPGQPELAMGAIASGGVRVLLPSVIAAVGATNDEIEAIVARERRELERREHAYRGDRPPPRIRDRTVILVDDGLATGATMLAAARALRMQEPARIVVAAPVASIEACESFKDEVDDVICARTPDPFFGVGLWYADFSQTTDQEVHDLLERVSSR